MKLRMPRLDTKLETEGAEFLVLGQLLLHRIPTYKTYTNMPGYDLVATNPETNKSARIQVKSRWRTGAPFFLIREESLDECDFVVAVRLNRGQKGGGGRVCPPEYFVLPIAFVKQIHQCGPWAKVFFRDILASEKEYRDNWSLIDTFLADIGAQAPRNRSRRRR